MVSASQILWVLFGSPSPEVQCKPFSGTCWVCGGEATLGVPRESWLGASFVGQNRVKDPRSEWVCIACTYVCARLSPVPGRPPKEGKELGGNFRNYSHFFDDGAYFNATKGEKPSILSFVCSTHHGPWFAAIAESGQKHVLPWAPVNPEGCRNGRVLFEEMEVTLPLYGTNEWYLPSDMINLLTEGATKESLGRGQYTSQEWQRCQSIQEFERKWSYMRDSPFWALSLFLAQRDEMKVQSNAKVIRKPKR